MRNQKRPLAEPPAAARPKEAPLSDRILPPQAAVRRFDRQVVRGNVSECWKWTGYVDRMGYGQIYVLGRLYYAHRFSFWLHVADPPVGVPILHSCDTPSCVNPAHLRIGNRRENQRDMADRWRGTKSSSGLPFGVIRKASGRFTARVKMNGSVSYLGTFDTAEEASSVARSFKAANADAARALAASARKSEPVHADDC